MTLRNEVISIVLRTNQKNYIPLSNNLRCQVLPSISFLPMCQKHHFAAFIADREELIVWDDDAQNVLSRAQTIMADLMKEMWNSRPTSSSSFMETKTISVTEHEISDSSSGEQDLETGPLQEEYRPIFLQQAVVNSLALALMLGTLGVGLNKMTTEVYVTQNYVSLALLLTIPYTFLMGLVSYQQECCVRN